MVEKDIYKDLNFEQSYNGITDHIREITFS